MKQAFFTLMLLSVLATCPLARAANAAADVKSALADQGCSSAADVKTAVAVRKSQAPLTQQVLDRTRALLPAISILLDRLDYADRMLQNKVYCLLDSQPIIDKHSEVEMVVQFPLDLWKIVSGYAALAPKNITPEMIKNLFDSNDPLYNPKHIRTLSACVGVFMQAEPQVQEFIAEFRTDKTSSDECWPYSQSHLEYWRKQGYHYEPYGGDLTFMIDPKREREEGFSLGFIPCWLRESSSNYFLRTYKRLPPNNQSGENALIQTLNLIDQCVFQLKLDAFTDDIGDLHWTVVNVWDHARSLSVYRDIWLKILPWFVNLPHERQEKLIGLITNTHTYKSLRTKFIRPRNPAPKPHTPVPLVPPVQGIDVADNHKLPNVPAPVAPPAPIPLTPVVPAPAPPTITVATNLPTLESSSRCCTVQ